MASNKLRAALYEQEITFADIARNVGTSDRLVAQAVSRWEGQTGNPRGKTRQILKEIENATGFSIYQEAV